MAQLKISITCPRWVKINSQIEDACWENDIKVKIEVTNHVLTKDIRIKATASEEKLERLKESLEDYGEAMGARIS